MSYLQFYLNLIESIYDANINHLELFLLYTCIVTVLSSCITTIYLNNIYLRNLLILKNKTALHLNRLEEYINKDNENGEVHGVVLEDVSEDLNIVGIQEDIVDNVNDLPRNNLDECISYKENEIYEEGIVICEDVREELKKNDIKEEIVYNDDIPLNVCEENKLKLNSNSNNNSQNINTNNNNNLITNCKRESCRYRMLNYSKQLKRNIYMNKDINISRPKQYSKHLIKKWADKEWLRTNSLKIKS